MHSMSPYLGSRVAAELVPKDLLLVQVPFVIDRIINNTKADT